MKKMWIRSQDESCLIEYINVLFYKDFQTDKFFVVDEIRLDVILGIYSTEEKAIKVTNLIKDAIDHQHTSPAVFYMPQDDEV